MSAGVKGAHFGDGCKLLLLLIDSETTCIVWHLNLSRSYWQWKTWHANIFSRTAGEFKNLILDAENIWSSCLEGGTQTECWKSEKKPLKPFISNKPTNVSIAGFN